MKDFKNFTAFEVPEDGLEDYLESFIESREQDLKDIRASLKEDNFQNVKKILHKWEGYAEPYGFGGLRTFASRFRAAIGLGKVEICFKICDDTKEYIEYKESQLLPGNKAD
ncbi:MAG: hypothetical protein CME64_16710 [Halobacteriovoraceae bacterium]|nr:hypothetical protein [Halobacteriovoraceae bacterium]|tara:strand:+ start:171668 stop:172000 length:333 start_codon:yes stop_codon:yes gene_type:complete